MVDVLQPNDELTRFIYDDKYIDYKNVAPKTILFTQKHPEGYSVYKTTKLGNVRIKHQATKFVTPHYEARGKTLKGWNKLDVEHYIDARLTINSCRPPLRHYEVFGMPVGADLEEALKVKSRQKMVINSRLHIVED